MQKFRWIVKCLLNISKIKFVTDVEHTLEEHVTFVTFSPP